MLTIELSVHKQSKQVYFEIVHPIQNNESNPDGVESPEIVVVGARHGDKAELTERLEKKTVRNPDASISNKQDAHDETEPS